MRCVWIGWRIVGAAALSAGCLSGRPEGALEPSEEAAAFPILRERSSIVSPLRRAVRLVIRSDAEYARLPLAEVDVDFRREMVLLVGLGPTHVPRYGIRITAVRAVGAVLAVDTETQRYEPTEALTPARGSPYHLVVVPWSERNVAGFETRVPADLLGGP